MAEKLLQRKGGAKKSREATGRSNDGAVTIVGTYKDRQLAWIGKNGIYNYPVRDGDELTDEACGKITELWLYADAKGTRHAYVVTGFVGKMSRGDFLKTYPTYPKKSSSNNKAYYVFSVKPVRYDSLAAGQNVVVRTADFGRRTAKIRKAVEQFRKDGEFAPLAAYLPSQLADVPKGRLRVCEAAVQMNFFCAFCSGVKTLPATMKSTDERRLSAMSLFSGAGGLDIGVIQAGFEVLSCVELDHNACDTLRYAVAARNGSTCVFEGDIRKFTPEQMLDAVGKKSGEVDLLFGGPPCQAFSLIGKQKSLDDERGMLLFQMIRYAKVIRPRVIMMEQVKGLLSAKDVNGERGGVLQKFLAELTGIGYVAKYKVCLAADYGAAQLRERVIMVATRDRNGFEFPSPQYQNPNEVNLFGNLPPWRTVGDVLSGLGTPAPKQKGTTLYPVELKNHVDVTPERDRERIHYVPEGLYLASQRELPKDILGNLQPRDTTKYLRLSRKRPSNTLRCGEIFFHPTEDRYLTPREYMRIHGYPDDYVLMGPIRSRTGTVKNLDQHRQVANSVPPPLAKAIASQIYAYLANDDVEV